MISRKHIILGGSKCLNMKGLLKVVKAATTEVAAIDVDRFLNCTMVSIANDGIILCWIFFAAVRDAITLLLICI